MTGLRTLIADPSPAIRHWLGAGLGPLRGHVTGVEAGWELLWHLAEQPFDLVVANVRLPDVAGHQVLAMVRTAGSDVPFLLVTPFCPESTRAMVNRLGAAEVVDDWTDGRAIRAAGERLMAGAHARRDEGLADASPLARAARWLAHSRLVSIKQA